MLVINPPKNTRGSNVPAMYYLHGLADGDAMAGDEALAAVELAEEPAEPRLELGERRGLDRHGRHRFESRFNAPLDSPHRSERTGLKTSDPRRLRR